MKLIYPGKTFLSKNLSYSFFNYLIIFIIFLVSQVMKMECLVSDDHQENHLFLSGYLNKFL